MASYERSRDTSAPSDRVWQIWSDTSTWPQWNPDVRAITLDGPFDTGTTGSMTTGQGTHKIRLESVVAGRSFDLVTSPVPATAFRFHFEITPSGSGSRISQSVSMSGLLAPIFAQMMGNRIAKSFEPILAGLAGAAESTPKDNP
jgi:Polyketide cyclase / dehydrase and lipid transport